MDPSGELLEVVTMPVRDYLKKQSYTIRCIILLEVLLIHNKLC
jgi:hypothetical protein